MSGLIDFSRLKLDRDDSPGASGVEPPTHHRRSSRQRSTCSPRLCLALLFPCSVQLPQQPAPQVFERFRPISRLAAVAVTRGGDARWAVSDLHGRVALVDVLATRAPRTDEANLELSTCEGQRGPHNRHLEFDICEPATSRPRAAKFGEQEMGTDECGDRLLPIVQLQQHPPRRISTSGTFVPRNRHRQPLDQRVCQHSYELPGLHRTPSGADAKLDRAAHRFTVTTGMRDATRVATPKCSRAATTGSIGL